MYDKIPFWKIWLLFYGSQKIQTVRHFVRFLTSLPMTGSTSKGNSRDSSLRFATFGMTPGRVTGGDEGAAPPPPHHPQSSNKSVIPTRSEESLHQANLKNLSLVMECEMRNLSNFHLLYKKQKKGILSYTRRVRKNTVLLKNALSERLSILIFLKPRTIRRQIHLKGYPRKIQIWDY